MKPNKRPEKSLKFASEYSREIIEDRKDTTIRYKDEKGIKAGDRLKLKVDTEAFARAKVTQIEITTVLNAIEVIRVVGGRHNCNNWKELRESMNRHYEDKIYAQTMVKVIFFELQ